MDMMTNVREVLTNMFVFCNPYFDYNKINLKTKNIIYVPKGDNKEDLKNYIPCLFIPEYEQSSKFLIYFHGNSDDIFSSELFCQYFSEKLNMNVIIVEYPGYSIYNSEKSAETICEDSLKVYDFVKEKFNKKDEDIYVIGRSLGTGPAVYLASNEKVKIKKLFLISPFKSIKSIKNALLSFFLKDIFKSIDIIDKVKCQIFFIHGKNDPLIDFSHSEELNLKSGNTNGQDKNILILNPEMTHNEFDVEKDIFNQILQNWKEDPQSFPKYTYNLDDKKFRNIFDIPVPFQKYFFKLNINLKKPTIFEKSAKCAFLLNDGRIAIGLGSSEVIIYNIDWCLNERELNIKTNNNFPITFMTQLRNNNFVVCDSINVYFYSLGKFKYKLIDSYNCNNKIKKVDQLESNEIIILTNDSIEILDDKFKQINEIKGNYIDLEVISSKIIISNSYSIEINEIINKMMINIEKIDFKSINSINSIIKLNNKNFVILGKNKFIKYNLDNFEGTETEHNIEDPSNICGIDNDSFLIWNKNGKVYYIENNVISCIHSINSKNISSIIKLSDGSLIITKDSVIKHEALVNNNNEDCKLF